LLLAYLLPWEYVHRVVAQQWTFILTSLFQISSVMAQYNETNAWWSSWIKVLFPMMFFLRETLILLYLMVSISYSKNTNSERVAIYQESQYISPVFNIIIVGWCICWWFLP
jgi:uncharacterized membrane protein